MDEQHLHGIARRLAFTLLTISTMFTFESVSHVIIAANYQHLPVDAFPALLMHLQNMSESVLFAALAGLTVDVVRGLVGWPARTRSLASALAGLSVTVLVVARLCQFSYAEQLPFSPAVVAGVSVAGAASFLGAAAGAYLLLAGLGARFLLPLSITALLIPLSARVYNANIASLSIKGHVAVPGFPNVNLTATEGNERSAFGYLARANLLLISIDTQRSDHMSAYGYERLTTPNADRLASEGLVFENASTAKTHTAPSLASVLTGTHPRTHGVFQNGDVFHDSNLSLAEVLHANGYRTAAVLSNPVLARQFNFSQGFAISEPSDYDALDEAGESLQLNQRYVFPVLDRIKDDRFFLWIHYRDPHTPYVVPAEFRSMFLHDIPYGRFRRLTPTIGNQRLGQIWPGSALEGSTDVDFYVAQYDAEIRYCDEQIGALLDRMEKLGLLTNTLILYISDHGESLGEHGLYFRHGDYAYDDNSQVPLIIRHPAIPGGRRVTGVVSLVDLFPSTTDLLGIANSRRVEGKSFAETVVKGDPPPRDWVFIEARYRADYSAQAIRSRRYKLIEVPQPYWAYFDHVVETMLATRQPSKWVNPHFARVYGTEFYDLEVDPGETRNLPGTGNPAEAAAREALWSWISGFSKEGQDRFKEIRADQMEQHVRESLKALGYIE